MLHATFHNRAQIYDLQELFRQPSVDAAIVPMFSRRRYPAAIIDADIVHAVLKRMDSMDTFGTTFVKAANDQCKEILTAIRAGRTIDLYRHRWSHKK